MKKVITILTVLVVLAGILFATVPSNDKQRITVKSTVACIDPTFILKLGNTEAVTGIDSADGTHDGLINNEAVATGKDISLEDITQTFKIAQKTVGRNRYTYTFSVTATNFVQVTNANSQAVAYADAYKTPNSTVTFESVSTSATAYVPAVMDGETVTTPASGTQGIGSVTAAAAGSNGAGPLSFSLTYDGKAEVAAADLATFTVKWTYDREAPTGDYLADITMTVSAT